jgi:hypothetical protein
VRPNPTSAPSAGPMRRITNALSEPSYAAIFLRRVRATRALPRNPASNSKPQPQTCSQHEPPAGPPLCRVARSCEMVDQNLRRVWRCMD